MMENYFYCHIYFAIFGDRLFENFSLAVLFQIHDLEHALTLHTLKPRGREAPLHKT